MAKIPATPDNMGPVRSDEGIPMRNGHIGWIVAGSLAAGVVVVLLLAGAAFIPVQENNITAVVPVVFMGVCAVVRVARVSRDNDPVQGVCARTLLAVAICVAVHARGRLH